MINNLSSWIIGIMLNLYIGGIIWKKLLKNYYY
jgi:hypothetical protein